MGPGERRGLGRAERGREPGLVREGPTAGRAERPLRPGTRAGPSRGGRGRGTQAPPRAHRPPPPRDAPGIGAAVTVGPRAAPPARTSLRPRPARRAPPPPPPLPDRPCCPNEPSGSARGTWCPRGRPAWGGLARAPGPRAAKGAYCPGSAPSTWRSPSSSAAALWVCAGGRYREGRRRGLCLQY